MDSRIVDETAYEQMKAMTARAESHRSEMLKCNRRAREYAEKAIGLSVGDYVVLKRSTGPWRSRREIEVLAWVTSVSVGYDENSTPRINGNLVKKDGTHGKRSAGYISDDSWRKATPEEIETWRKHGRLTEEVEK